MLTRENRLKRARDDSGKGEKIVIDMKEQKKTQLMR